MVSDASFLVEEFINAITSQLDRVQDALRIKAVNRPLTYALKDFFLELQVFVEMDPQGNVRFRTSGPNETGASTIRLGFTTITKPMIEENTISLAMTRSPSLDELGLDPVEQQKLEQFGVRNAAQLQRLGSSTGTTSIARLSGVPVERLRQALQLGHPRVTNVKLERVGNPQPGIRPVLEPRPAVSANGQTTPSVIRPESPSFQIRSDRSSNQHAPELYPASRSPKQGETPSPQPVLEPRTTVAPVVRAAPGFHRLSLMGSNLIGENGPPVVRLNSQPLEVTQADDHEIVVEIKPQQAQDGSLEIELPGGEILSYNLSLDTDQNGDLKHEHRVSEYLQGDDPWLSRRGEV